MDPLDLYSMKFSGDDFDVEEAPRMNLAQLIYRLSGSVFPRNMHPFRAEREKYGSTTFPCVSSLMPAQLSAPSSWCLRIRRIDGRTDKVQNSFTGNPALIVVMSDGGKGRKNRKEVTFEHRGGAAKCAKQLEPEDRKTCYGIWTARMKEFQLNVMKERFCRNPWINLLAFLKKCGII